MQHATDSTSSTLVSGYGFSSAFFSQDFRYLQYKIICRNGFIVPFMPNKVSFVMTKAFISDPWQRKVKSDQLSVRRELEKHAI
jgi:hypothetical protein